MARIGLKYPIAAEILDESALGVPTYDEGFVLGHAVEANVSIEAEDSELWADDMVVESDAGFAGGTIALNVDHLNDLTYATITGHEVVNENGATVIKAKSTDSAPYFGVGYLRVLKKAGVRKYRAIWLYKVLFSEPSDEGQTKQRTMNYGTDAIDGSILELASGAWQDRATFATEADARQWLESKAGLIGVVDKTALSNKILEIQGLEANDYTAASYGPLFAALEAALLVEADADATQIKVDAATSLLTTKQGLLVDID